MDDRKPIDKKQKTKKVKKNHKEEKRDRSQTSAPQEGKTERADSKTSTLKRFGLNRIGKKPDIPPPEPPRLSTDEPQATSEPQPNSPRKAPLQPALSQPQQMADLIHSLSIRPNLKAVGSSRTVDERGYTPQAADHRQPARPPYPSSKSVVRRTHSHEVTSENENNPLPRPRHRPPLPPPPEAMQSSSLPRDIPTTPTNYPASNGVTTHDSSGEEHKPRPIPRARPKETSQTQGIPVREEQRLTGNSRAKQASSRIVSSRGNEPRQPESRSYNTKQNRPLPRAPKVDGEDSVGNGPARGTPPGRTGTAGRKMAPVGSRPNPPGSRPAPGPKPQVPHKPVVPRKQMPTLGDWKSDNTLPLKVREVFELAERGHKQVEEITALSYSRPPDSESYVMEVIEEFKDIYHQVMDCSSDLTSSLSPQARFSVRRNINTLEMRFGEMDSLSNSVGLNPSSSDVEKIAKLASGVISTIDELCSSLRGPSN